jgi:hypothetical protein
MVLHANAIGRLRFPRLWDLFTEAGKMGDRRDMNVRRETLGQKKRTQIFLTPHSSPQELLEICGRAGAG